MAANNVRIGVGVAGAKAASSDVDNLRDKFARLQKQGAKGIAIGAGAALTAKAMDLVGSAVSRAADFMRDAIQATSNLGEALSKSQAVFGSSADGIEKWAATAATSIGQSKRSALEAAGTFGNLLQAFGTARVKAGEMSKAMVELASDLASFNNTSVEDAIEALRSGLSGETEPLKRYGIAISDARMRTELMAQGVTNLGSTLTPLQKTTAAYTLIMKDSTLAQGDFARTAEGLANKQRTANAALEDTQAKLGTQLLPAQLAATNAQIDLFTAVGTFADALNSKVTPEVIALKMALGQMSQAEGEAAIATLRTKEAAAEAATAYTAYEGKRGLWITASKEIAETLPEELEAARERAVEIANRTPGDIADAIRDGREEWVDAMAQLREDIDNPMTNAVEFARLKARVVGPVIAKGLKDGDPVVRAQAAATRQILLDRLEQMGGDARKWGRRFTNNLAAGMLDRIQALQRAARLLAKTQADYLKYASPAKEGPGSEGGGPEGWSRHFVDLYARGMSDKGKIARAASGLAAASRPGFGASAGGGLAMAGAAGGAPVVIQLQVDGRTLAEIVDRNLFYMQSPGGILPRR